MLNWRQNTRNTKGRVVLRGDFVKYDSGSFAVFTEQGSSASQMTAAMIMDIISRLPGCEWTSSRRSISLYPSKRWKMLTNYSKFSNRSVQTFGFVYPRHKWPRNHGPVWKTQSFLLKGICMVILWQDYYGKGNPRKSFWSMAGRKFQIGSVSLYIVKKDYSYLCMWMTYNWLERNKILIRCGKDSTKKLILGRTNIFPGSCILKMHSTTMPNKQRYCGQLQNHVRIANFRLGSREITIHSKSSYFFMVLWYGGVMQRNVWSDIVSWQNKTTQQLYKVSTLCIDDHHFKEGETKSVGELSTTCSQIVLKCSYLARIGRPDILWSVNKLARSITKWTNACDKRLNRLISYIHRTCEYWQYCHVG